MEKTLSYNDIMHRYGRIFTIFGMTVMLIVPTLIMVITGVAPDWNKVIIGVAMLSIIYLPGGIVEMATYSPILGTSATYLAFITGNLVNLKIPCVMNARAIVKTEIGTPENEVVSTLSVVASTLTTVGIMSMGIILLIPLRPILSAEVLQPAFNWVVSALFGALGYKYFKGNLKIVAVPLLLMVVLAFIMPGFVIGNITIVIMVGAIISVLISKLLYDKKLI
jgi:hypothetical protein